MRKEVRGEIPTVRTEISYKTGWTDEVAVSAEIQYIINNVMVRRCCWYVYATKR